MSLTSETLPCFEWPDGAKTAAFAYCPDCRHLWIGGMIAQKLMHECENKVVKSVDIVYPRRMTIKTSRATF